ncbi:GNAT family N-acetyltransferase [Hahella sp. CR1]|uniref:GNAT family N-acetyltransferase n=1 Tax=Hahella sp. CR1 TaxID=2992807 RepID=UPI002441E732|nr:GNAT family N-acetyltransferase [Hahella sp. CR1]MDG9672250.1 GNAT family N-acetyltransferase [Hahella sp. CR1]
MRDYVWIGRPPVYEVPAGDRQNTIQSFSKTIEKFTTGEISKKAKAGGLILFQMAEYWGDGDRLFGYKMDGELYGLVSAKILPDHVHINYLVGHPHSKNASKILIGYLLNLCPPGRPIVKLQASEHVKKVYQRIGFSPDSNGVQGSMTLDLLNSHMAMEHWCIHNNKYFYTEPNPYIPSPPIDSSRSHPFRPSFADYYS